MTFSTRFGVGVSLSTLAVSWVSNLLAQLPTAPDAPAPIPSNMTLAAAIASVAASVATVVTIVVKQMDTSRKGEETGKKLDEVLADLKKSKRQRAVLRRKLEQAQGQLNDVSQGLDTTRRNNHDRRDAESAMWGELRVHALDTAAAVNTIAENQSKVIAHLNIPDVKPVPKVEIEPLTPAPAPRSPTPVPPMIYLSPPQPEPKG